MAGLAVDFDVAARLLDETIDLAQAEAGALAGLFGGEERLEGARGDLLPHADALVGHRDQHVLTWAHLGVVRAIGFVEQDVAGLDGQAAALRHRIARIDGEIENRGFQLHRVGLDRPNAAGADHLELHRLAERRLSGMRKGG